jgi:hypothetical protein
MERSKQQGNATLCAQPRSATCRVARGTAETIVIGLLLAAVGCTPSYKEVDDAFLLATARAVVAFAEAEQARERPAVPPSSCNECRGTGTVLSGDGLARVPCPCREACRCEAPRAEARTAGPAMPARRRRLLYFTANWCASCRANDATLTALRARGWKIGVGEENHIQVVDLEARPDLRMQYRVDAIPTWLMIDEDREQRRQCGVLDPFAVARLLE